MNNKDFEQLKQLDRIEYMLRENNIGVTLYLPKFIFYSFGLLFIIVNYALLIYIALGMEGFLTFMRKITIIPILLRFGIITIGILDIISIIYYLLRHKKLTNMFKKNEKQKSNN